MAAPGIESIIRASTSIVPPPEGATSFELQKGLKSFKYQYSNIYFVRLRALRKYIEDAAQKRWSGISGNPIFVPRVLEVIKSKLCYIVGTVYMNMPLKPNVLIDLARDQSLPPPPPSKKFFSEDDEVMLEDESGRIRLVGNRVKKARLVTGVIMGALGVETPTGDFEVVDLCFAGMAPQSSLELEASRGEQMDVDEAEDAANPDEWIAVVSGLNVGSPSPADGLIQILIEFLNGETGTIADKRMAAQISRLVIAGNSLSNVTLNNKGEAVRHGEEPRPRKRNDDPPEFTSHPIYNLSAHLLDLAGTLPVHILPGEGDPSGVILPQQPFPRAMFGSVTNTKAFKCETNPAYIRLGCGPEQMTLRTILVHSGQPLNDMFKYLPTPPHTRLDIMESTLKWRHLAPTAPDTLWCHPYFNGDPFVMIETPDIYIAGGQKRFATRLVEEEADKKSKGVGRKKRCRIILVPEFSTTGTIVLVNLRTLETKTMRFGLENMTGGVDEVLTDEGPDVKEPSPPISESMFTESRMGDSSGPEDESSMES
ncbi:hypothetical protein AX16_002892 [Volvariella volvacea WC 439]|nr:hypothetical protein AX16_002892 [Volvariella volvacea WC 439]